MNIDTLMYRTPTLGCPYAVVGWLGFGFGHEGRKLGEDCRADFGFDEGCPAEEFTRKTEGLARPAVEIKGIVVFDNKTVLETEFCINDVVDFILDFAESVVGFPMSGADGVVGLDITEGEF